MTGMLSIILAANGLRDYGVCAFDQVEDKLINCMAKGRLPDNAKSVVTVLFPYRVPCDCGNLSRYAVVPDYHEIAGHMLTSCTDALKKAFQEYDFVWFIDNSPIPEVYAAALSGLGVVGDNHLLINKKYGSYCFIGTIVTSLEMPITGDHIEYCSHCGRCISECRGKALHSDGTFDRSACLSDISQRKGNLSPEEVILLRQNGLVWGCDTCQDVCPLNVDAEMTYIEAFLNRANPNVTIDDLSHSNDRAYLFKGKRVIERNIRALEEE